MTKYPSDGCPVCGAPVNEICQKPVLEGSRPSCPSRLKSVGWDNPNLPKSCLDAPWRSDKEPVTKASLLDAAKAAVADRGLNYGKPESNFRRIASLWTAHIRNRYADPANDEVDMTPYDGSLDEADVAMMMVLLKIARLENDPTHQDSWIDIAGYAACGGEITGSGDNST